ncbi:MAG: protein kinase, partial [bacterium]|nr:protein kinase [bacterium]
DNDNLIGESPSSQVHKGTLTATNEMVAVKIFKRGLTSDGFPEDDMRASIAAGTHQGLIKILGKLSEHPEGRSGIVLSLVPSDYKKLGHPPDFETCTRDTYLPGTSFTLPYVLNTLRDISSACEHLHARGISHGDIYAHNILSNREGRSLLGDFGAASFYDSSKGRERELLDVRAFGCLTEDLLDRPDTGADREVLAKLRALQQACKAPTPTNRPSFREIKEVLSKT